MLAHNTTNYEEIALKRFEENIGVLNFYFDTPIITQIQLELRWVILIAFILKPTNLSTLVLWSARMNVFDQIAAIGGTLGLFTGISIITFVEVIYWVFRFVIEMIRKATRKVAVGDMITVITETHKWNTSKLIEQYVNIHRSLMANKEGVCIIAVHTVNWCTIAIVKRWMTIRDAISEATRFSPLFLARLLFNGWGLDSKLQWGSEKNLTDVQNRF